MKKRSEKYTLVAAFIIPVILMLGLFAVKEIYPFGEKAFLTGDLYHQYLPFFRELLRKVSEKEGFGFSFRVGIGSNFMALFGYYLASPFHMLAFLIPEKFLMEFIGYMMIVKTGLCSLTATIYLRKHFQTQNPMVVLFAFFYAFSGYMAAYSYNIMWIDCVWLLPLILLGVERLIQEGKCGLYCVTLALCIYTNFYLSIMVCLFIVLYFGMLLFNNFSRLKGRQIIRRIGCFALFSLLAGGMAAVLLIPEVCAILQTDFGDVEFPNKLKAYFSALDVLARHCICVNTERGLAHWPNIYCGSMVILMIPLYIMNRQIPIREKFSKLALAGFMVLSFRINLLDFLWHGMNYPDSLPGRQSFIYIFLILTLCYDAFHHVKQSESQHILYGYLCAVLFYLFCDKFISHEDFEIGVKLETILFVTVYCVLLYIYSTRDKKKVRCLAFSIAAIVVMAECSINMANTGIGTSSRAAYVEKLDAYQELYEVAKEREDGLFRVEQFDRKTKNDSEMAGFTSASVFSSTLNSQVMDLYTRLGMRHSKVYYCSDGSTALTAALLNIKYMYGWSEEAGREQLYEIVGRSENMVLYQNRYYLPFGYVAPVGYDLPEGYEYQALELQNRMVKELGVTGTLFDAVSAKKEGDDVHFTAEKGGNYYAILTAGGTAKVDCIGAGSGEVNFKDLKKGCVLELGYLEQEQEITLTNGDEKDDSPKVSAEIYLMNETVLQEALTLLSKNQFRQTAWESDFVSGHITMDEPGRLILSIPNEDGWQITVNGEITKAQDFGGVLMAFDLEPGFYEIEMKYVPKGKTAGILVSIISIALFAGVMQLQKKLEKRTREPEQRKPEERKPEQTETEVTKKLEATREIDETKEIKETKEAEESKEGKRYKRKKR